ncbi:hypothetical protein Btru_034607, partial [Bulinus truncatus]
MVVRILQDHNTKTKTDNLQSLNSDASNETNDDKTERTLLVPSEQLPHHTANRKGETRFERHHAPDVPSCLSALQAHIRVLYILITCLTIAFTISLTFCFMEITSLRTSVCRKIMPPDEADARHANDCTTALPYFEDREGLSSMARTGSKVRDRRRKRQSSSSNDENTEQNWLLVNTFVRNTVLFTSRCYLRPGVIYVQVLFMFRCCLRPGVIHAQVLFTSSVIYVQCYLRPSVVHVQALFTSRCRSRRGFVDVHILSMYLSHVLPCILLSLYRHLWNYIVIDLPEVSSINLKVITSDGESRRQTTNPTTSWYRGKYRFRENSVGKT